MKTTGDSIEALAERVDALIVTQGGQGSIIHSGGKHIEIPPIKVKNAVDPTGCGDAYRAGLLLGLERNWDWETSGRVASLIGAIKVRHEGTQNHTCSLDSFCEAYNENFDRSLSL